MNEEELELNVKKFIVLYCGKDYDHDLLLSEIRSFRREFNEELSKMFTVIDILEFLLPSQSARFNAGAYYIVRVIYYNTHNCSKCGTFIQQTKIIKSYSRSTISQERLDGLALLSIESEQARKMDKNKLLSDYVFLR